MGEVLAWFTFNPVKHRKPIYELMELYRWIVKTMIKDVNINNQTFIIKGVTS